MEIEKVKKDRDDLQLEIERLLSTFHKEHKGVEISYINVDFTDVHTEQEVVLRTSRVDISMFI